MSTTEIRREAPDRCIQLLDICVSAHKYSLIDEENLPR